MQAIKVLQYGIFDSKKDYSAYKISPVRKVERFEFDFILSCSENATSYIDNASCKLSPNMVIIRKPGQKSNTKLHFKCYCLHLQVPKEHFLYEELTSFPNYLTFINEKYYHSIFESLIEHIIKQQTITTDYFIYSKIFDLIYHIKKDAPQNLNTQHRNLKKEHQSIQKAVNYIKTNFSSVITLKDLGELTGYSPNHFQQVFKSIIGITPQKYLEEVRITRAKYLLIQNEKSITDIAYECGFSSHSHLTRVFKNKTLLTPFEYEQKSRFKF
ncbi:MAG: helix-turn-helix transcriptional regulator [Clostridia bacterium]|nr:helix-turn-helix transcriptional regulator [Clostridia bacterium]